MGVPEIAANLTYDCQVTIGGTDVSKYVTDWAFDETLGQKAKAKLVLVDKDANNLVVRPGRFGPDGGSNELHPHNLTASTPVIVNLETSGMPSEYPAFLINDVEFDNGAATVHLEDYHALIEQDGVSLADILAENGDTTTAAEAIQAMAATVSLLAQVDWADYPINELRRAQGSLKRWIDKLGLPYQAYTQFFGSKLYSKKPDYTGGAEFELTDVINLTNLSFRETTAGHKNKFRSTRLQPGASQIRGTARGTQVGRNSQTEITISPPVRSGVFYQVKAEQGALILPVWFDEGDNVLGSGYTYTGNTPAAKCVFTYIYTVGTGEFDPEFQAHVLGSSGQPTGFDTSYNATSNTTSAEQTYYGVREEFSPLEDPAWPTSAIAQLAANNMALENANQRIVSRWGSWLNPRVRAGTRVGITDWTLRQSNSLWLVRSASHRWKPTGGAIMNIGCTRRRA